MRGGRPRTVFLAAILTAGLFSCGEDRGAPAEAPTGRVLATGRLTPAQPDVAPDTSFVIFVAADASGRDLFRFDCAAGETRPLTRSPEVESHPRISPDGSLVAFLRAEEAGASLWVMNADGSEPRRLGTGPYTGPAWAPHGASILVATTETRFPFASVRADDDEALFGPLHWPIPTGAADPTWGEDGIVVFTVPEDGQTDLYFLLTGGDSHARAHPITRTPGHERQPRYADGRLVYVREENGVRQTMVSHRTEGGFTPPQPLAPEEGEILDAVPWPGTDLLLTVESSAWGIMVRRMAGGDPVVAVPADGLHTEPLFNADGQDVFYTSNAGGNPDIYVVELAGLTVANLTTGVEADYQPDYSAAKERLVFVTERDGNPDLLSIDQSGLDDLMLAAHPAADTQPRFSPDGDWVAFVSDRAGSPDLWVVPSAGGEPERVTFSDGAERSPTWVEDGAALVYEAETGGSRTLWRVPLRRLAPAMVDEIVEVVPGSEAAETGEAPPEPRWEMGEPAPLPGETDGVESVHPRAVPDGRRVIYTRLAAGDGDLWWLDLESGERTPLVEDSREHQDHGAVSADGTYLTYQSGGAVRMMLRRVSPADGAR